jgi:uncharacterized protein (TIGR04255 family)
MGHIFADAQKFWDVYEKCLGPVQITQIGLRYVNRIEIKLPLGSLEDWMSTYPEIAEGAGPDFSHFFMQLHLPQQDIGALAVLNETIMPKIDETASKPMAPEAVYIMLDIDISQAINDLKSDSVWSKFESLRLRKNRIFKSSITAKTEELFNR